jgi:hypothetical protein
LLKNEETFHGSTIKSLKIVFQHNHNQNINNNNNNNDDEREIKSESCMHLDFTKESIKINI